MKKFIVGLKAIEYSLVEVEAENAEEACTLAFIADRDGMVNWDHRAILAYKVEKAKEV
jgi:ribosome maturation factor RimP